MFSSIYIGYSGLLGFSKGLDTLSHNVSNLNTPGFKSSDLIFRDLLYRQSTNGGNNESQRVETGGGVDVVASRVRFHQGELRDTGGALDAAIDGNGFFVLRKDGQTFYTRSGQFDFNADGFLVDKGSGARVAASVGSGNFDDISITDLRTDLPAATSRITFNGNLERTATGFGPDATLTQAVFDAAGGSHTLTLVFSGDVAASGTPAGTPPFVWSVTISEGSTVVATGQIAFQGNGSPDVGANSMNFTFSPTGAPASNIELFFGDAGSLGSTATSSFIATSSVRVSNRDGRTAGSLTQVTFNERGELALTYSNGRTATNKKLALAWFENLSALTQGDHGLFTAPEAARLINGTAGDGMMGSIAPHKIELSNVQLTDEFTQMVIIQRGYQASSQVISVTNEMIQQLLDLKSHR
jgi:flagellar hook protein FlgE